jgi:hypothetical protein
MQIHTTKHGNAQWHCIVFTLPYESQYSSSIAGSGVKLDKEVLRAQDVCLWFHEASAVTFLAAAFLLRFGSYLSGLVFVLLGLAMCAQKTPIKKWHKAFEAIPELNVNAQYVAAISSLAITGENLRLCTLAKHLNEFGLQP